MPVIKVKKAGKKRHDYDDQALAAFLCRVATKCGPVRVWLEKQHPMKKQGLTSTFSTGTGFGVLRGVLAGLQAAGLPVVWTIVPARTWQRVMLAGLPKNKSGKASSGLAAQVCADIWPDVSLLATRKSRKPHEGLADALVIAEYGRRQSAMTGLAET